MKYSISEIKARRYDTNRSHARRMRERFIPLNVMVKLASPYTTFLFLNLGISPDMVTYGSILITVLSGVMIIFGHLWVGLVGLWIFALLDSTDGDMARVTKPSAYGGTLDSFGADVFYAVVPFAIGIYLEQMNVSIFGLSDIFMLYVGSLVSISFILYRLINAKVTGYLIKKGRALTKVTELTHSEAEFSGRNMLQKMISIYRHELLKGNLFAEAGVIFLLTVLALTGRNEYLGYYLFIMCLYNLGYLLQNFMKAHLAFRNA